VCLHVCLWQFSSYERLLACGFDVLYMDYKLPIITLFKVQFPEKGSLCLFLFCNKRTDLNVSVDVIKHHIA